MAFHKTETSLPGVYLIRPDVFSDDRGFFMELYHQGRFASIELDGVEFVQDNLSFSKRGTIRGLHFQAPPFAQGKLVTVLQGEALDIIVDLRRSSATFGQSASFLLKAEEPQMLWVPAGFAHGFQVLSEECLFLYKCTNFYHRPSEMGLRWDDPVLNLPWEDLPAVVSDKDQELTAWADFETPFV